MNTSTTVKKRIQIVDALRGFALAGIVVVHMVENYVGAPLPQGVAEQMVQGIPDYIVNGFIELFLRGKFFAIFSFLFGLSFFLQMSSARDNGVNYSTRFLWRLLILFGIGYVHHLFYRGDILTIYAFFGLFLVPFNALKNKWLLAITAILFLGLGRFIVFYLTEGEPFFLPGILDPNNPDVAAYYEAIKHEGIVDVFYSNATQGHLMKADFQLGIFSRGYLTLAFFLLGLYIGRIQFFKQFRTQKKWTKKVLIWSVVALFICFAITAAAFSQIGPEGGLTSWLAMIGLTGYDLSNIAMTFIILALFVQVYKKQWGEKLMNHFVPYGRMALTNYVAQSIIGTFILYGWGLGYLTELRNSYTFLIALLIIGFQMWISKIWLNHFRYGPLEWLWRMLTYLKWIPLKN